MNLTITDLVNEFGWVKFQNRKEELTPMVYLPSEDFVYPDEETAFLLFDTTNKVFFVSKNRDQKVIYDSDIQIKFDYAYTDDIGNLYMNDFKFNISKETYIKYL